MLFEKLAAMKWKIIPVLAIVILVLIIAAVMYARPRPVVEDISQFEIDRVEVGGVDVTDRVDLEAIKTVLAQAECRHDFFPWGKGTIVTDEVIMMSSTDNHKSHHIVLTGKVFYWYRAGDKRVYHMIDGEILYQQLYELVQQTDP